MKTKDNVLLQYTISTFIGILIISILLGLFLTRWTANIQVQKHIELYPEVVREYLTEHKIAYEFMKNPNLTEINTDVEDYVNDVMTFKDIFKIKIFDTNKTVLWSDDKNTIGQPYNVDPEYFKAVKGGLGWNISKPDNESEAAYKKVLEIYTPVLYQGKTIAVVELYENMDVLYSEINQNIIKIYLLVALIGITIYFMFFIIFYSSHTKLKKINKDLLKTQEIAILSLASLSETRDKETGEHLIRTQRYIQILAEHLKHNKNFKHYLTRTNIDILVKSSPLHDIGKVGVPDAILKKQGKLTPEEFEEMKKHTVYGYDALEVAEKEYGKNSFLEVAREIAYTHHEKWDGSGYPRGLKGSEIPISGRLMAIADVYDALISKRVYKKALTHDEVKSLIVEGSGKQFDPEIVDAFLHLEKEFYDIAIELDK